MQAAYGLSTAAVWGAADFTGGIAAKRAAPSFVVAVAHGFSLILLFAFAAVFRTGLSGCGLDGLLSGVFCGGGLILLYSALSRGSMGLSAAISGVLTAVVPVLYSSFREGHASPRQLIGFAVASVAIALVAYTPQSESSAQSRGLGLAVLAGLSFGAMLVFMHLAAVQGVLPALIAMRISSTSVAVIGGVAVWLAQRQELSAKFAFLAGKTLLLAMLAGVLDTSGNLLYLLASRAGRLDVAAVLSSLYPAGTILLATWLLKERATRGQVTGMALALAAIALIAI
ncbi:MAG TPA: EamA family transporter [Alloacidobacterium sp.]|nr:EamA family transporter [Alloacidobacterium sp.]